MALDSSSVTVNVAWSLLKAISGFNTARYNDSSAYRLSFDPDTTATALFIARYTVSAAADQTIDLSSFTDPLGTAVAAAKVYLLMLVPTGTNAEAKLEPGASNGLTWFLSGTTPAVTVPAGGVFLFAESAGETINGTHKNIKVTNTGSGTLTLDVVALLDT